MILFVLLLVILIIFYVYKQTSETFNYWKKKGALYVEPTYFFGNLKEVVYGKKNIRDVISEIYYSHKDARYIGCYQFFTRNLLLRDPDLIVDILNKQFDHFCDHSMVASKTRESVWASTLLVKTVEDGWAKARAKFSPVFTGRKLRIMIPLMQECVRNLTKYVEQKGGIVKLDIKTTFAKLTSDIITSAAFGVSVNSIADEKNLVYTLGREASDFSGIRSLIFAGYTNFPKIMDLFQIRMFKKSIIEFFTNLVIDSIDARKKYNLSRVDFIHLLTKDREELDKEFQMTTDEVVAHCITVFIGGSETVSTLLTMSGYELALHPEIQNKIYEEIVHSVNSYDENITYESIRNMRYLDCVISEVLRLHPPAFFTDRKCVKPYTIQPKYSWEKPLTIDKGVSIWVPIMQIHRDPKYFPEPYKFDPERFNSENKKNIPPYVYLPFGTGPRFCIGQRYALLVVKVILIDIIKQYEFVRLPETTVPLELRVDSFFMVPKNKLWIGLKPRQ